MEEEISVGRLEMSGRELDIFESESPFLSALLKKKLYPPLPMVNAGEKNILVWGWAVLQEARKAGVEKLRVRRMDIDPVERLRTALLLEDRRDNYSFKEKSKMLDYLIQYGIPEDDWEELSGLVASEGSFIPRTVIYRNLSGKAKRWVDSELLDLKTAGVLSRIPDGALDTLEANIARFSFSNRRRITEAVSEICVRDGLSREDAAELIRRSFQTQDPLRTIMEFRFPRLSEMEKTLADFRENHLRGTGVVLEPPRYFEGDAFQVTFTFTSTKEYLERLRSLEKISDKIDECLDLL